MKLRTCAEKKQNNKYQIIILNVYRKCVDKAGKKREHQQKIRNIYHFEIDVEVYQIRITLLLFCSLFSLDVCGVQCHQYESLIGSMQ